MPSLLKTVRNAQAFPSRVRRAIVSRINPVEREFRRIWPFINNIEGLLISPVQEFWLFSNARSLPNEATIVEIGSFKGRSTCCLAYGCRGTDRHVFAIDVFSKTVTDLGCGSLWEGDLLNEFKRNIDTCEL